MHACEGPCDMLCCFVVFPPVMPITKGEICSHTFSNGKFSLYQHVGTTGYDAGAGAGEIKYLKNN